MSSEPLLHLDCLSHTYSDGTVGIHDLCFKVFPKEIVGVCGPNGSGKSTLLEHLNGILIPSEGEIMLEGERIDKKNPEKLRRSVGLVFQDADSQLFAPTVMDDVMFGPINTGMPPAEAKKAAEWALDLVGFAEKTKIPHYLSGGEKRLVAIAGVIAMKPKIVAVDEPTSDLDPVNAEKVEKLLLKLRDELGLSVVISTHDMDLASRISDRVYILKKGVVLAEGTPRDLFYDEGLLQEAGLKPPEVVGMYKMLVKDGVLGDGSRPLMRQDLLSLIEGRANNEKSAKVI
ncbi:MAG: energy-coupling factor ABC transporter ATP-binding protein [Candidatus Verstraetearchaeota archaeon]|nr:energy-coupling factor ABC transporter ATP-binding protein [Candidatus Verstraetearchaeota archaeon]